MRRLAACLWKNLIESTRDWKITSFALVFSPAFVLAMSGFLGRGNAPYTVGVVCADRNSAFYARLAASTYDDGVPHYVLKAVPTAEAARAAVSQRSVEAAVVIPAGFDEEVARALADGGRRVPRLGLYGDPGNARYAVAAIFIYSDLDAHVRRVSGRRPPAEIDETLTGQGAAITEFDAAVPGLIVFALLNALLTAGAAFLREVDTGTMLRLSLSRLRAWEFVGAITVVQAAICVAAMVLALLSALLAGFHFRGTLTAMTALAIASSVGVVGAALLTAACLKTMHDLLTVGVAPYFVIMFFSGLMFPMKTAAILHVGSRVVRVGDLLPLASSVPAFDRVMNYGTPLASLGFDLALIAVVSAMWFGIGLAAFRWRHMRLAG